MSETLRAIMKRKSGMTDLEYDVWIGKVQREASEFRHKKIKEVFSKPKEERDELEVDIINSQVNHYGANL